MHKFTLPPVEFTFAGLTFPRFVAMLPRGKFTDRIAHMRNPVCGPYYHSPTPITRAKDCGRSFYLDSDFMPGLRWRWADDIAPLRHNGWYTDDDCIGETIRGLVMRLPHGRGFLPGWSMGKGMASAVDYHAVYDGERDCAYIADDMARNAAEREREYQAREREREAEAEAEAE